MLPRALPDPTAPTLMDIFYKILQTAVYGGASDVHLKVCGAVIFRINR